MKNCLVFFGNKKRAFNEEYQKLISQFSASGWTFDKVAFVAFDDGDGIVSQLCECKQGYDVAVLFAPPSMEKTLKDYLAKLYNTLFVQNELHAEQKHVYLVYEGSAVSQAQQEVIPSLNQRLGVHQAKMVFKAVCVPQEKLQLAIARAKAVYPQVEYFVTENFGDCTLEIFYSDTTPKMLLDEVSRAVVSVLDDYLYALEDITLAQQLFRLLSLRRMQIAVAESFTGGGVCQKLVEVSGVSAVFYEGLNTYSNQSKMERLGVQENTLKQHGAVSEETAYQMAQGLIDQGHCDISIATTGIAGPKSDNTNKPVGLCYIAVGLKDSVAVKRFVLSGNRENVTKTAIHLALFLAYKRIK